MTVDVASLYKEILERVSNVWEERRYSCALRHAWVNKRVQPRIKWCHGSEILIAMFGLSSQQICGKLQTVDSI